MASWPNRSRIYPGGFENGHYALGRRAEYSATTTRSGRASFTA